MRRQEVWLWLNLLADETQGVQVKLRYPLTMRAIPERLRDASCGGATQIDDLDLDLDLDLDVLGTVDATNN